MAPRFFPNPHCELDLDQDLDQDPDPYPADVSLKKAQELAKKIEVQIPELLLSCTRDDWGKLYSGPVGIAFAFWYLQSKFGEPETLLDPARTLLEAELDFLENISEKHGFLNGSWGVYAVAAVLSKKEKQRKLYLKKYADAAQHLLDGFDGTEEVLSGRAGYLCGSVWLQNEILGGHELLPSHTTLEDISNQIIRSGIEYSHKEKSPSPLMHQYDGTEYLGPSIGFCGILQMLLSFMKEDMYVRDSVNFLLALQHDDGNYPADMTEVPRYGGVKRPEDDDLVQWCMGAPGVIHLMAKAYLVYKDEKYLQAALKCGECIWNKGLLKKGPGLCHGVAGNGYAFLLLYRLTDDKIQLYRAKCFAKFMETEEFIKEARTPDHPYSLFEGLAGTICFLADLSKPETAAFPFFDAFET